MERIKLTKKQRFSILKRDNFTCRYCGRKTPEVILEVDHIVPVSKGGTNDLNNLITSCRDCNRGKGADFEQGEDFECCLDYYEAEIMRQTDRFLTEQERDSLKKLALNYGFEELGTAIDISIKSYYKNDFESFKTMLEKIGGILYNRRRENGNL